MAEFILPRSLPVFAGWTRVVCIGDTYGELPELPPGDILIHTGNFSTPMGNLAVFFLNQAANLPYEYKIIICGRSDHYAIKSLANDIHGRLMCVDGATTKVHGLRIASATQVTPNGIINKPLYCRNDIVISHIPPWGILDENENGIHIGSQALLDDLEAFPPKVCIFGGNPVGHGAKKYKGILCINAGQRGLSGQQYGIPLVVDVRIDLPDN